MDTQQYSIQSDVGSGGVMGTIAGFNARTVGAYYNLASAMIVVLTIVVIYLVMKSRQNLISLSPTQTARYVQVGLSGSENLSGGRDSSVFAQTVQGAEFVPPSKWYDTGASPQLSSEAVAFCSTAGRPSGDASGWLQKTARSTDDNAGDGSGEPLVGGKNLYAALQGF